MKNLSEKRQVLIRRKNQIPNLEILNWNTVIYRDKSIRSLGPHIWNGLPEYIKNENSYDKVKENINIWYGLKCTCSLCSFTEAST